MDGIGKQRLGNLSVLDALDVRIGQVKPRIVQSVAADDSLPVRVVDGMGKISTDAYKPPAKRLRHGRLVVCPLSCRTGR